MTDDVELQPLRAGHIGGLRLPLQSRFTGETLAHHLALNPDLSWRAITNGQYIVGGFWRRRPEIVSVVEIDGGPFRRALVERVIWAARQMGCQLVVSELQVPRREAAGWTDVGFEPVDSIVEYEKRGTDYTPLEVEQKMRRHRPEDFNAIADLERRSFPWIWWNSPSELVHYGESSDSEIWVIDSASGVAGYAGLTVRGDHGHLDRLAVDPRQRRRGLGSALLAHSLDRFEALGARRITLTTQSDNLRAQPLYRRFGFQSTGQQLTILGRWLGRRRDRTP